MSALRLAQAIIIIQTATTPSEIANALNINRTTAYRNLNRYKKHGPAGLITDKKTNRKAYKLNGVTKRQVQTLLNEGYSLKAAAKKSGITEGCIRYAIKKGTIVREKPETHQKLKTASERSKEDNSCATGIGAKRDAERVLASIGKIIVIEKA